MVKIPKVQVRTFEIKAQFFIMNIKVGIYRLKIWKNWNKQTFSCLFQPINFQHRILTPLKGKEAQNFGQNSKKCKKWCGISIYTNSKTLGSNVGLLFWSDPATPSLFTFQHGKYLDKLKMWCGLSILANSKTLRSNIGLFFLISYFSMPLFFKFLVFWRSLYGIKESDRENKLKFDPSSTELVWIDMRLVIFIIFQYFSIF